MKIKKKEFLVISKRISSLEKEIHDFEKEIEKKEKELLSYKENNSKHIKLAENFRKTIE